MLAFLRVTFVAVNLITEVPAVRLPVTLEAAMDAGAILTLEPVWTASRTTQKNVTRGIKDGNRCKGTKKMKKKKSEVTQGSRIADFKSYIWQVHFKNNNKKSHLNCKLFSDSEYMIKPISVV